MTISSCDRLRYPVVGTTGLSPTQIYDLTEFADKASTGCLIIPNFSIGMVLLQQAAIQASQYFDHVEIIELHHNQKADAPSGTAIQTAQMLAEMASAVEETEIPGSRGVWRQMAFASTVFVYGLIAPGSDFWGSRSSLHFAS